MNEEKIHGFFIRNSFIRNSVLGFLIKNNILLCSIVKENNRKFNQLLVLGLDLVSYEKYV